MSHFSEGKLSWKICIVESLGILGSGDVFFTYCTFAFSSLRKDNVDQLGKIVSVLGTPDLYAYIARINFDAGPDVRKVIAEYAARERTQMTDAIVGGNRRVPWLSFRTAGCPVPSPEALDLLDKLLVYDHDKRLTAQEAMAHPFFDDVRDRVRNEVYHQSRR